MVSRNLQSLKVPDPRVVTEVYAFILKFDDDSGPPTFDVVVAISVDDDDWMCECDGMAEDD